MHLPQPVGSSCCMGLRYSLSIHLFHWYPSYVTPVIMLLTLQYGSASYMLKINRFCTLKIARHSVRNESWPIYVPVMCTSSNLNMKLNVQFIYPAFYSMREFVQQSLCLFHLPQMVALYKDPKGENVLKSNDAILYIKPTIPDGCSCHIPRNGTSGPGKNSSTGTTTTATANPSKELGDDWYLHFQYHVCHYYKYSFFVWRKTPFCVQVVSSIDLCSHTFTILLHCTCL